MTTTKALSGFRPSRKRGNNMNNQGTNEYPIASGYVQTSLQVTLFALMQGT